MTDQQQTAQILRDFGAISFAEITLILFVVWLVTLSAAKLLPYLAEYLPARGRLFLLAVPPVLRLVMLSIAVGLVIPRVIDPTPQNLLALLGAAGLAIGFAFKDYVSSLIAGVVAIYERPYRPGDWVQVEGTYGEVTSLGLRAMQLVTPDDTVVTIPHMKMWNTDIHNATNGERDLLCVADFYLQADHDAAAVRQRLRDIALTSPFLQTKRPINVVVAERPWGAHYRLKAYPVNARDQFVFTTDLTVRGKAALTHLGVVPARPLPVASLGGE